MTMPQKISEIVAALSLSALLCGPAAAAPDSVYTATDLEKCKLVEEFEQGSGARYLCPGYKDTDVSVVEGDLRFFVSYGPGAENQCAARQTFGPFNNIGPRIEWRLHDGIPFATILRWFVDKESGDGQESWLVVTRLAGRETCHIAYVFGGLSKANELARKQADLLAASFDCKRDVPVIVTRSGVNTERLYPRAPCVDE